MLGQVDWKEIPSVLTGLTTKGNAMGAAYRLFGSCTVDCCLYKQ